MAPDDASRRRTWLIALEEWLWSDAFGRVPNAKEVAELVCDLSDLYTLERGVLGRQQGKRSHLPAKLFYFLAADAPKVALCLDECAVRSTAFAWPVDRAQPLTLLDVGCGVGATSVGAILWWAARGGRRIDITAVDAEPSVLATWATVVRRAAEVTGVSATLRTFAEDGFDRSTHEGIDLILCQTALNERLAGNATGDPRHTEETARVVTRWARTAATLLIEPALRTTTRALQGLRDRLLADAGADLHVVAPCPHASNCPMLANERDWCHESRRTEPTPRAQEVQTITRRRDAQLLYSFLALAPGSAPSPSGPATWRLVSDPLGSRGKTERWVCCDDGRLRMVRVLDRERSEMNEALASAERGTLVELPVLPASDRIGPEVVVRRSGVSDQPRA